MSTRGTGSKPTRSGSKTTRKRSTTRKSTSKTTRKQQPAAFDVSLPPEHQRELFALALLTIALLTVIFYATGNTGGIGGFYLLVLQQMFGSGALLVPLLLGAFGLAILAQERLGDTPLSGANLLGIVLALGMLLALFEYPVYHIPPIERPGQGGGLIGFVLVDMLVRAIGRPAATFISVVGLLVGVMLTFGLTLRGMILGIADGINSLGMLLWSGNPETPAAHVEPATRAARAALPAETTSDDEQDMVPTPIAARLTRASLFQRPGGTNDTAPAASQRAAPPEAARGKAPRKPASPDAAVPSYAQTDTSAPGSNGTATAPPIVQPQPATETQPEALDGFESPVVYRPWPMPTLDMLEPPGEGSITNDEEHRFRSRTIEETLKSFKVEVQVVGVNTGPSVTQFEVQPAVGVKISKITALQKDLALSLAAPSIRIEAPIPGKAVVGIEIPNTAISVVTLREVIDSDEFDTNKGKLKLPLGKDISGNPVVADMTRMPHLLVAGSTGSGKSVAINAFICGLLLKHTPEDLKVIMVDPKMVELIVYNRIPHLLSPVVTELERVVPTLKWATREMERRYKLFARHGCRNLESYKQLARRRADLEPMPYILLVIDELADLMMMAPDEIETYLCRLAQMARATGIHLIIATQRPSVDVITGLIKANFPSRMAFAVTSQVDSRVILDTPGAEQLLGRGDMLYMAADSAKLVRIQGTFVADREIERLVNFWRAATPPEYTPTPGTPRTSETAATGKGSTPQKQPTASNGDSAHATPRPSLPAPEAASASSSNEPPAELDYRPPSGGGYLSHQEQDELLPQALELVQRHTRASASLLQRRLRIGYSKAAQLIDLLEQQGVVGPAEGGRSREVLAREPDGTATEE